MPVRKPYSSNKQISVVPLKLMNGLASTQNAHSLIMIREILVKYAQLLNQGQKNRIGKEIGKDAAEKSKGLFSADDWVCSKCGNVNWARRNMCNICNAPKLADLEVRTGYGGGYMDREEVEYIQRNDDEEEFDEFGRKKKRKRMDNEPRDEMFNEDKNKLVDIDFEQTDNKVIESEEAIIDEEDEEEDGDDDSKYDLTADLDLDSFKLNIELLRKKAAIESKTSFQPNDGRPFFEGSDCSCSCSGGDCSCVDSEDDSTLLNRRDENGSEKRIEDKQQEKDQTKEKADDRRREDKSRHDRDRERRDRSRDRSRDRHHRKRSRSRSKDRSRRDRSRGDRHRGRSRSRERRRSRDR